MGTLTLGPLTFHGQQTLGAAFFFSTLTDWLTLPDSKAKSDPIPQQHGSFDGGPDWSQSAIISVEGFLRGTTRLEALQMVSQLKQVRSLTDLSPMTLDDEDGVTTRRVSVKRVKVSDIRNQLHVSFVIDVESPDPKRYGVDEVVSTGLPSLSGGLPFPIVFPIDFAMSGSPGRVVTTNSGDSDTYSRFEVTGALSAGFSLIDIEDGRELRVSYPVSSGQTVFLDPASGRVWIDNEANDITGSMTVADWWAVPAGGSRTIQFAKLGGSSGTPTFTARTPPAFL